MNCDHCGRATSPLRTATTPDGMSYCERADCREAYREKTGERHRSLTEELHGN